MNKEDGFYGTADLVAAVFGAVILRHGRIGIILSPEFFR
jgi:hypothetical protein